MADLNNASVDDIVALGIDLRIARVITFWAPFHRWEDLLFISEIDDDVLDSLQSHGFEIAKPADASWALPRPFRLSSAHPA